MSETPKTLSIKPPSGSFVSKDKIVEAVQAQKAAEEINRTQTDVEKEKAEAADKARIEEIDRLLPRRVLSSYGEISYETFKSFYASIWEQVKEKEHLAIGYCTFVGEALPGVTVTLRTLRTRENRAILRWMPVIEPGGNILNQEADAYYRSVRLALALTNFDGNDLPPLPEISPGDPDAWIKQPMVAQKIEWLDKLPEEVVFHLGGVLADVTNAFRLALRENLKNLSAPLSRS